jgi:hypothetical protein
MPMVLGAIMPFGKREGIWSYPKQKFKDESFLMPTPLAPRQPPRLNTAGLLLLPWERHMNIHIELITQPVHFSKAKKKIVSSPILSPYRTKILLTCF